MPILQAATVVLAVDFVSGLVHWAEDTFFTEETPLVGAAIITPNVEHHERPSAFLAKSYWESNGQLMIVGGAIAFSAALLGTFTWHVALFALLAAHTNQIHKWAHMPKRRVPSPVAFAQHFGLLQSLRHHARHHRGDRNTQYCTVTTWLNPLLDRLGFWRVLEHVTVPFLGAPRRLDLR